MQKILIVGAGVAGRMLLKEIQSAPAISQRFDVVGFLDDDQSKSSIDGAPIVGTLSAVKEICERLKVDQLIFAIPSAEKRVIEFLLDRLVGSDVKIRIIPGLYEIISGDVSLKQVRDIEPTDLLGREEVGFDFDKTSDFYDDKIVLVTGGGGSIGSEIVRQLLKFPVRKVYALGHGENSIHELGISVQGDHRFDWVIADVRDRERVLRLFEQLKPDIVFHAAANKHVYLMERYPDEALKSNVFGTYNCAIAAISAKVSHFVLVSTDKAVKPTSIMGATKNIAEKLVSSLRVENHKTKFAITRFGNVLGSRGSIVPKILSQIKNGLPITITHPDVTRYFMSIREAARLVVKSATLKSGSVFVLDMGKPVLILELAHRMVQLSGLSLKEVEIVFTGLGEGEKLHEILSTEQECLGPTQFDKLLVSNIREPEWNSVQLESALASIRQELDSSNAATLKKLIFTLAQSTGEI